MVRVRLTGRVNRRGAGVHEAGTVLQLDDAAATRLIRLGVAEKVERTEARPVESDKAVTPKSEPAVQRSTPRPAESFTPAAEPTASSPFEDPTPTKPPSKKRKKRF